MNESSSSDLSSNFIPSSSTVYYDIDSGTKAGTSRQSGGGGLVPGIVDVVMNFNQRFFLPRMWEIRVTQIPFSQRAPVGCLQYYFGGEGLIQTFNFADNGRHLANQNYRACVRQETGMCSISYEPCDDQSFRIGPNSPFNPYSGYPGGFPGGGMFPGGGIFPGGGGFPGFGGAGGAPGAGAGFPGLPGSTGAASSPVGALADPPAGGVPGKDNNADIVIELAFMELN